MRSKSLSLIALAVAAVVAVPGLVQAQQPIRIGASIAITGRDAIQGGYVREGYLLCQKHVNEKGGTLGRPIEFLIRSEERLRGGRPRDLPSGHHRFLRYAQQGQGSEA